VLAPGVNIAKILTKASENRRILNTGGFDHSQTVSSRTAESQCDPQIPKGAKRQRHAEYRSVIH
jgi:hypothetical protein